MVCKPGKVCKNCAECFGCHAMKSATVIGNCRPKISRTCPKEKALRRAEELTQNSTGAQISFQNIHPTPSIPKISKTIHGNTTSYSVVGDCTIDYNFSIAGVGQQIRFPQCPGLTFLSMKSAFDYFEAQARLQEQCAVQVAGQLADYAAQQARLAKALDPCEPIWQFGASLKPANAKAVVRLPPHSYLGIRGPHLESAAESVSQDTWKAPGPVRPSSRSSPPEIPPQTLFAESTPHAQDIQAKPRVRLPAKGLQPWSSHSQAAIGSNVQQPLPSLPPSNQAWTVPDNDTALHTYPDAVLPLSFAEEDDTLDQPQIFYGSYPLPSSYSDTAFPQTLAKKDRRILGVSSTAGIDEIRAGFWLRDFQYNADRYQAASLEERAVAALKLRRAQEAVDRLCGCHQQQD